METVNTNGVAAMVIESQKMVHNSFKMSQAYVESKEVTDTKALTAELCRHFYTLGWLSGTGGSITIKAHDDSIARTQQLIIMSPSGVQKERMVAEDMYVLSSDGFILSTPPLKLYPYKPSKCSDCAILFMKAYEICNAGAVIHSHGLEACLVTMINPFSKEFRINHMEMIKGIKGHGYHDELVVPIIENTAHEGDLCESFTEAMRAYPKATAVLVRNHGVFIWGDSWISAKTQAECYHYLFDAAIKLHQLRLNWSCQNHATLHNVNEPRESSTNFIRGTKRFVLLTIEGTVTPMSFLKDILFPYAQDNVEKLLMMKRDIVLLRSQFVGLVFNDVPEALKRWHALGIKVYIYSTASREIQQLLLANSDYGDLRKYLCGFFDTSMGNKQNAHSYFEILQTVGIDRPADMLFVADSFQEAMAAKAAGLEVMISIRPGNGSLPEDHGFKTITSLLEV